MSYSYPFDERNSEKYHTGKLCIEKNCLNKAGTAWSPHWCFTHNVERMKNIEKQFSKLIKDEP